MYMLFTYYLMFIDLIFIMFMYIIFQDVKNNKNLSLATSFIMLFIIISVMKFFILWLSTHYDLSLCDISRDLYCSK